MSKYFYNTKTGHYELNKLFEADEKVTPEEALNGKTSDSTKTNNTTTNNQTNTTNNNQTTKTGNLSLFANENYKSIYMNILNLENIYLYNQIPAAQKELNNAKIQLLNSNKVEEYDINADPQVITLKNNVDNLTNTYNNQRSNLDKQLNKVTSSINSTTENQKILFQHKILNESNLQNAKVYLGNLIFNDDNHLLKTMNDFKKIIKPSNLLYGKDKTGYFVICVDKEDFDKLSDVLINAGFSNDDIVDNIIPQLFNRENIVK